MDIGTLKSVVSLVKSGGALDGNFASDVNAMKSSLTSIISSLTSAGLSSLASTLAPYSGGEEISALADNITDQLPNTFDNLSLYSSYAGMQSLLGESSDSTACPSLDTAFGGFTSARSALTSVSNIQSYMGSLGTVTMAMSPSGAPILGDSSTLASLQTEVQSLAATLSGAKAAVAAQVGFVETATSELTNYTNASMILGMASNSCAKSVLGAVGSSNLMSLI